MNLPDQLAQIDRQIDADKETQLVAKAMERLTENRDFRDIILKGYFQNEAARLVMAKADVNLQSEASQKSIIQQIDAIGSFHAYMNDILMRGRLAEKSITQSQELRDVLVAEDAEAQAGGAL